MRKTLPLLTKGLLLLMLTIGTSVIFAQIPCPTGNCADLNNPGSANFYIADIYVANSAGVKLTPSDPCNGNIYLYAKTAGTANNGYTLKAYFEIWVGGVLSETIDRCFYEGVQIPEYVNFGLVSWTCGQTIELKNIYLSWQPNSNNDCGCRNNSCLYASLYIVSTPVDLIPPSITCPGNYTANTATGVCHASVVTANPTYSDNNGVTLLTWSMSGATSATSPNTGINTVGTYNFNTGTTTVSYVAADAAGNTASCSFTVAVTDNQPPSIVCPGPVTVSTNTGVCYATGVNLGLPVTSDNCAVNNASLSNNAPSQFPKGQTTVTWSVADVNGNTSTCTQLVTVNDTQAPSITCPGNITEHTTSASGAIVNYTVDASDNCTTVNLSYSKASGTLFPVGTTTVYATATDGAGNSTICSFKVEVINDDCVVIGACSQTYVVELYPVKVRTTTVYRGYLDTDLIKSTIDNCGSNDLTGLTVTFSKTVFTPNDWGENNWVTISVYEGNTLLKSCTFRVIVRYPLKSGDLYALSFGDPGFENLDIDIQVFPNPTTGKLKMEIWNLNDPRVTAVIYNTNGAVVMYKEFSTTGQIDIDLTGKVSGLYLMRVVADNREFLHKIVLQNR
jgi:hypothetical protein